MTGGIVDVGGLYDCLSGIYDNKVDDSILDKYSDIRREKYMTIVDPISSQKLIRLNGENPDTALETDEFLKMCKRVETDLEFSRQMQRFANELKHDFTKDYTH